MAGKYDAFLDGEDVPASRFDAFLDGEDSSSSPGGTPIKIGKDAFPDVLRSVLRGADWGTRNLAGAGTALDNLAQGLAQFFGKADKEKLAANRIIAEEAPVGSIAGEIGLAALPFSAAGNSVRAASAIGAGLGVMQPVAGESLYDVTKNKATSALVGGASAAAGQVVANKAADWLGKKTAEMAARKLQNSELDATLKEGLEAGYVVPPSMMPDSGTTSRVLEGLSGKFKTNQLASIKNQTITDRLARKAIDLPENAPINQATLKGAFAKAGRPFEEFSKLGDLDAAGVALPESVNVATRRGFDGLPISQTAKAKDVVQAWKQANADARGYYAAYSRDLNPETQAKAQNAKELANKLFDYINEQATKLGRPELAQKLKDARVQYAKIGQVEEALIEGGGRVDAKVLARRLQAGKPMSGELATIAKMANNFGDAMAVPKSGNASPFTALDFMQGGVSTPLGVMAGGPLGAMAALGLPVSRVASRYGLLSSPVQSAVARPEYAVDMLPRITSGLLSYSPETATVFGLRRLADQPKE